MRQFHRLPFSPGYQFRATRPLTIDGIEYRQGDTIPPGALDPNRLRQLYDQRKVEPIVPDAPAIVAAQSLPASRRKVA